MLFLQFMLYSSSFVGTLKNKMPEAALELCQLKIKQLSPDILKFRTKHEDNQDNPFTLNCFVVSRSFLFIFHAGPRGLGPNKFRNSSYKEKTPDSAHVSRLSFRFLWLWSYQVSTLFWIRAVFLNVIRFTWKLEKHFFLTLLIIRACTYTVFKPIKIQNTRTRTL